MSTPQSYFRLDQIMPGWYDVRNLPPKIGSTTVTSLAGDNATDDSANLETILTALGNAGGGRLWCGDATYLLSRAPTTVQGSVAQVHFPSITGGAGVKPVSISLVGNTPPPMVAASVASSAVSHTFGPIFRSTATSGAVFGGAVTGGNFTIVNAEMESLTIRTADNPQTTAIDFSLVSQCRLRNVQVDTGVYPADNVTQPTHSTYGIKLPGINCGAMTKLESIFVMGYATGILLGEHADLDGVQVWACTNALEVGNQNHGMRIARLIDVHCTNGINCTASGTPHPRILMYEFATEYVDAGSQGTAPAWQIRGKDLLDASNLLFGLCNCAAVKANVGPTNQFLKTGGTNFSVTSVGP